MIASVETGGRNSVEKSSKEALCDPCRLRGQNLMQSRVVQYHVLIILFLAGRLHSGGFQTFQTERILSLKFVSHLEVICGAFCF